MSSALDVWDVLWGSLHSREAHLEILHASCMPQVSINIIICLFESTVQDFVHDLFAFIPHFLNASYASPFRQYPPYLLPIPLRILHLPFLQHAP